MTMSIAKTQSSENSKKICPRNHRSQMNLNSAQSDVKISTPQIFNNFFFQKNQIAYVKIYKQTKVHNVYRFIKTNSVILL